MPRILTVDVIQKYVGDSVRDPYGRVLGRLVSFESDVDGVVENIVVENENRTVSIFPAEAVKVNGGVIEVEPDWKVKAVKVLEQYRTAVKRFRGLEELYNRGEVSARVYHAMKKKLETKIAALKDEAKKVKDMITRRIHEIEDENLKLDRVIAELKVSYIAGEVSERAYKQAIEPLRQAKESNTKELEEIRKYKRQLESVEEGSLEVAVKTREEHKAPERSSPATPSMQGSGPVTVHIVG
ncbi:MAG: hypothetical protein GXO09_02680 [Crenarchaeota archaeon]|nr:hypothetical protein [Thermoproteota archaeon]